MTFPDRTTSVQAKLIEVTFKQNLRLHERCDGVKKALLQQLVKAIDPQWLTPIQNSTTHAIEMDIPQVLAFLFQEHSNVTPHALSKKLMKYRTCTTILVLNQRTPFLLQSTI